MLGYNEKHLVLKMVGYDKWKRYVDKLLVDSETRPLLIPNCKKNYMLLDNDYNIIWKGLSKDIIKYSINYTNDENLSDKLKILLRSDLRKIIVNDMPLYIKPIIINQLLQNGAEINFCNDVGYCKLRQYKPIEYCFNIVINCRNYVSEPIRINKDEDTILQTILTRERIKYVNDYEGDNHWFWKTSQLQTNNRWDHDQLVKLDYTLRIDMIRRLMNDLYYKRNLRCKLTMMASIIKLIDHDLLKINDLDLKKHYLFENIIYYITDYNTLCLLDYDKRVSIILARLKSAEYRKDKYITIDKHLVYTIMRLETEKLINLVDLRPDQHRLVNYLISYDIRDLWNM